MAGSIAELLYAVVRDPDLDLHHPRRVQDSDLMKQIGWRLVKQAWPAAENRPTRPYERLSTRADRVAREVIEQVRPVLVEATRVAERLAAMARGGHLPEGTTTSMLSERAATLAGSLAFDGLLPTTDHEFDEALHELFARLQRLPGFFDRASFAKRYADAWDAAWEPAGVATLERYRPASVCLGPDARPSLADPGESHGWMVGTGRSVYDRFALYWRGRRDEPDAAENTKRPRRGHVDPTPLTLTGDLGLIEVTRAAQGYGLAHQSHRDVIRAMSFADVVAGADTKAWLAFDRECPAGWTGDDENIPDAVTAQIELWRRDGGATDLENTFGPLDGHVGLVHSALTRKAWMELHARERLHEQPMCRCAVARTVRLAVTCTMRPALMDWFTGKAPRPDTDGPPAAGGGSPQDLIERENLTFTLLLRHPRLAERMLRLTAGWEDDYRMLIDREGLDPRTVLTVQEWRDHYSRGDGDEGGPR